MTEPAHRENSLVPGSRLRLTLTEIAPDGVETVYDFPDLRATPDSMGGISVVDYDPTEIRPTPDDKVRLPPEQFLTFTLRNVRMMPGPDGSTHTVKRNPPT